MLTFNLKPIFRARGIDKPYTFLIKAGFSPHKATNLTANKVSTVSLNHIGTLCRILFCEPNDLFMWTPDSKLPLVDDHPLLQFGKPELANNFQDIISTMPLKKLKEMTEAIADKAKS